MTSLKKGVIPGIQLLKWFLLLRETVLAMQADGAEELPLIATFELNQLIASPKHKALFWQDLLLAKSVLQNS
jgi:DNA polymerase